MIRYAGLLLAGVFISSISQVMLKKSAAKHFDSYVKEYMNPLVVTAYAMFVVSAFLSMAAYKEIPLSMGAVLETTGYIYITFWGVKIFNEKINIRKYFALGFIVIGILVYSFWG